MTEIFDGVSFETDGELWEFLKHNYFAKQTEVKILRGEVELLTNERRAAVAAEREACAEIADRDDVYTGARIAAAIRARGQALHLVGGSEVEDENPLHPGSGHAESGSGT